MYNRITDVLLHSNLYFTLVSAFENQKEEDITDVSYGKDGRLAVLPEKRKENKKIRSTDLIGTSWSFALILTGMSSSDRSSGKALVNLKYYLYA